MDRLQKYKSSDKMIDLISDNYSLLQVMSRFGLSLGFGDKTVKEVCEMNGVDCPTFLAVVNFMAEGFSRRMVRRMVCLFRLWLITYGRLIFIFWSFACLLYGANCWKPLTVQKTMYLFLFLNSSTSICGKYANTWSMRRERCLSM